MSHRKSQEICSTVPPGNSCGCFPPQNSSASIYRDGSRSFVEGDRDGARSFTEWIQDGSRILTKAIFNSSRLFADPKYPSRILSAMTLSTFRDASSKSPASRIFSSFRSQKDISVSTSTYLGLGIFESTREIPCLSLGNFESTREISYLGLGIFKSTRPRNALSVSVSASRYLGIFFLLYFHCRQIAFLMSTRCQQYNCPWISPFSHNFDVKSDPLGNKGISGTRWESCPTSFPLKEYLTDQGSFKIGFFHLEDSFHG